MEELSPLLPSFRRIRSPRPVYQLQDQRAPRANIWPPRQEVPANQRFKDARLAAALAPHHSHLGEMEISAGRVPEVGNYVMQPVHDRDQTVPDRPRGRRRLRGSRILGHTVVSRRTGSGGVWGRIEGGSPKTLVGFSGGSNPRERSSGGERRQIEDSFAKWGSGI